MQKIFPTGIIINKKARKNQKRKKNFKKVLHTY